MKGFMMILAGIAGGFVTTVFISRWKFLYQTATGGNFQYEWKATVSDLDKNIHSFIAQINNKTAEYTKLKCLALKMKVW